MFAAHKRIEYMEIVLVHIWIRWRSKYIDKHTYIRHKWLLGRIYDVDFYSYFLRICFIPGYRYNFRYLVIVSFNFTVYDIIYIKKKIMMSLLVKMAQLRGTKLFVGKPKKIVERSTNKLYPVEYFNEFTIPAEIENIRQRPRREAAILADIKGKFCD